MDPLNTPIPRRKMVTRSICWLDIRIGFIWFTLMGFIAAPAVLLAVSILRRIVDA